MILPPRLDVVLLWILILYCSLLTAQVDTLELGGVEVSAERHARGSAGVRLERYDQVHVPFARSQGVAEWLRSRSNIVLMGYGPGGSYGLSLRGGSSAQTQVMLNGIPFEHPGLAQADISLLPSVLFSDAAVYSGASGALLGNASVGGTLFLDTRTDDHAPKLVQDFFIGSFGERAASMKAHFGKKALRTRTVLYWRESKNNFDRPSFGNPGELVPQPNAFFRSRGLQQGLTYCASLWTIVDASAWYSETSREIPPSLSQKESEASQHDENLRIQAGIVREKGVLRIEAKGAIDRGSLKYMDPISQIDDPSSFLTLHTEAAATWALEKWEWSALAIYRNSEARTQNFDQNQTRTSPALVGKVQKHYGQKGSKLSAALRAEWLNGSLLPALPNVGVNHVLGAQVDFRASAGRVYRLPGLNDLFWNPGGNPNLRPEIGWSQEVGFDVQGKQGGPRWNISVTAFNRNIEDWIIWLPEGGIWTPQNLRKVWSRGLEVSTSLAQDYGALQFLHHLQISAVRSTQEAAIGVPAQLEGKQLAYIPVWSFFFSEQLTWKRWLLIGTIQYQSERFTNSDNSLQLDRFLTGDVELAYEKHFKTWKIGISLAARNIANTTYQIQLNRPMPGRNFSLGFNLSIF